MEDMQHNTNLHEDILNVPVLPPVAENHVEKPHVCKECGKQLAHKRSMKRHMLIHTGDRPHACTLCDFKTAYKHNLTQHLRTHSSDRSDSPHACTLCDYKTTHKSHLKITFACTQGTNLSLAMCVGIFLRQADI